MIIYNLENRSHLYEFRLPTRRNIAPDNNPEFIGIDYLPTDRALAALYMQQLKELGNQFDGSGYIVPSAYQAAKKLLHQVYPAGILAKSR